MDLFAWVCIIFIAIGGISELIIVPYLRKKDKFIGWEDDKYTS
jgi:hypothetical protein